MSLWLWLLIILTVIYLVWKGYNLYLQHALKMDPKLFEILQNYSRIRLIGCAGSGKSYLAQSLFSNIPKLKSQFHYISLDDIKHKPNSGFRIYRGEKYKELLVKQLEIAENQYNNKWIMEGNAIANKKLKIKVWNNTDVVIVFDYDFLTVFIRGILRSMRRDIQRNVVMEIKEFASNYLGKQSIHTKLIWYSHSGWPQKIKAIKRKY